MAPRSSIPDVPQPKFVEETWAVSQIPTPSPTLNAPSSRPATSGPSLSGSISSPYKRTDENSSSVQSQSIMTQFSGSKIDVSFRDRMLENRRISTNISNYQRNSSSGNNGDHGSVTSSLPSLQGGEREREGRGGGGGGGDGYDSGDGMGGSLTCSVTGVGGKGGGGSRSGGRSRSGGGGGEKVKDKDKGKDTHFTALYVPTNAANKTAIQNSVNQTNAVG